MRVGVGVVQIVDIVGDDQGDVQLCGDARAAGR